MTKDKTFNSGEGTHAEYKSSFNMPVIETLVAFANTKGGSVYVGVHDDGSLVSGFMVGKETLANWINEIKIKTQPALIPDVEVLEKSGAPIVRLSISEFPVKPVSCRGKYFKRVGNSNHQMTLNEIANLHLQTINMSWDFTVDPNHGVDSLSFEKVSQFIEAATTLRGSRAADDPLIVLRKYELLRDERITIGGFLLFCREPSIMTTIDAGRFDSETIIRDNATIRADLFSEIEMCMEFIRKHISKRYVITGKPQRDEVWEYPLEAIREIVINMIVHRDYRATADSTIKIFNDRIEFFNPGSLPDGVSLEVILAGQSPSMPRNKQIASMFKEAGIIEKYGSGIRRVREIMALAGVRSPEFEAMPYFFKVTLYPMATGSGVDMVEKNSGGVNEGVNEGVSEGVNEGVSEGVNEGVKSLLSAIRQQPGERAPFYAKKLGSPVKSVERWIKQLRDGQQIIYQGAPKTGGYYPVRGDSVSKALGV